MAKIINIIQMVKGLSHKKDQDPSLISNDLLKFSSINPPSTNARIKGGIGKSYNLKIVATTAMPIIKKMSKLLNDIKYIPVTEKNKIIGIKKVLGTASILAIYGIRGKLSISNTTIPIYIDIITDQKISGLVS